MRSVQRNASILAMCCCGIVPAGTHHLSSTQGQFRGSKFHGKGLLSASDGSLYEGDFSDGYKHGEGVYTYRGRDVGEAGGR